MSNRVNGTAVSDQKELQKQIENQRSKLAKARDLLIRGDISGDDYREVKKTCNEEILLLEAHFGNIGPNSDNELTQSFSKVLSLAGKLDFLFSKGDLGQKRRIIGSIFPENITFDGVEHRTGQVLQPIGIRETVPVHEVRAAINLFNLWK